MTRVSHFDVAQACVLVESGGHPPADMTAAAEEAQARGFLRPGWQLTPEGRAHLHGMRRLFAPVNDEPEPEPEPRRNTMSPLIYVDGDDLDVLVSVLTNIAREDMRYVRIDPRRDSFAVKVNEWGWSRSLGRREERD